MSITIRSSLFVVLALTGCGDDFFDILDDDEAGDSETGETGGPEPLEGLRVSPYYQLVDVPAVVSIEAEGGGAPQSCPPDPADSGGYLCDTAKLGASDLIVRVERDGYEPVARPRSRPYGYVDDLAIHLAPVGGPIGTWSACVLPDAFANCDEVCGNETKTCVPTSCATEDPDEPIATVLGFEGSECVGPASRTEAQACSSGPPAAFTDSLRCCCS